MGESMQADANPGSWIVEEVVSWLKSKEFSEDICDMFAEHKVNGQVLSKIKEETLERVGIKTVGDQHKILTTINILFSDTQENYLRLLCQRYWGRGREGWGEILKNETISVPDPVDDSYATTDSSSQANVSYECLNLGSDFEHFFSKDMSSILIREEYLSMLEHIKDLYEQHTRGVVVTGQPGIGKSTFLYYLLIHRLMQGKPTAFQLELSRTFLFLGPQDIQVFNANDHIDNVAYPGAWALTDSNADLITPRAEFTDTHSAFFLVQTTSPQPRRWKAWSNQLSAELAVMNSWTWSEIYIGASKFESQKIDKKTLFDVFDAYSRSPRECYKLASSASAINAFEATIDHFSSNPPDLRSDEISLRIAPIIPTHNRSPIITFPTQYVSERVSEVLLKCDVERYWEYFNLFWGISQSHDAAGWMWEAWIISMELEGGNFRSIPLRRLSSSRDNSFSRPIKRARTEPERLNLPFSQVVVFGNESSFAERLLERAELLSREIIFFKPERRNQKTFDAVSFFPDGTVTLFQPTIAKTHSVKVSGLDFVWDAIYKAEKDAKTSAAAATVQKFYPVKMKWHLVFCVPNRVQEEWKNFQSIDFQGIKPRCKWDDYIEEFVGTFIDEPERYL